MPNNSQSDIRICQSPSYLRRSFPRQMRSQEAEKAVLNRRKLRETRIFKLSRLTIHPFPVFEQNIAKIVFAEDLARQVTELYSYTRSTVQDLRILYSQDLDDWPLPAAIGFLESMIKAIRCEQWIYDQTKPLRLDRRGIYLDPRQSGNSPSLIHGRTRQLMLNRPPRYREFWFDCYAVCWRVWRRRD
jgi:hypothetical protein